jgi:hypothetical protein
MVKQARKMKKSVVVNENKKRTRKMRTLGIAIVLAGAISVIPARGQTNFTFGNWSGAGVAISNAVSPTYTGSDWTVTSGSVKTAQASGGNPGGWNSFVVGTDTLGLDGTSRGTIMTTLNLNGTGFSGGGSEPLVIASLSGTTQAAVIGQVGATETMGIIELSIVYSVEPGVTPPVFFSVDLGGSPAQTVTDAQGPNQQTSMDYASVNLFFPANSTVPDGGATVMLLGMAVAGLTWMRRASIART